LCFFWQSGDDAGIYGHGKVISRVRKEEGESVVDMRYTKLLDTPILKVLLRKHPVLKTFGVIAMPHGRNPFRVRDHEWDALKKLSVELREIANSGGSHRKNKG
jgi:hypothetical protein